MAGDTEKLSTRGGGFLLERPAAEDVFTPEDFNDEQRMISDLATKFNEQEVLSNRERLEEHDLDLLRQLLRTAAELGLCSADIPEAYGGAGLDKASSTLISEKVTGSGSFSVTLGAHVGIGTLPIVFFGNEEQKKRYLPKLGTAELVAAYALTEPGSGSDALGARTTAVLNPAGTHYILNGTKQWITNAGIADVFVVYAKVDGDKFTAFIVERGTPGFTTSEEENKCGLRGSSTRSLFFDNAEVPKENVLGEVGKGHVVAFNILNIGRWKLAAACVGSSKYVLRLATRYALERKQFGTPIARFPLVTQKLAEMAARTYVLESMVYRTAGLLDASLAALKAQGPSAQTGENMARAIGEYAVEASINKVFGSEALSFVVDEGVQIHGGYGYMKEYPIEAAFRDERVNRIFEGTNEINRLLIPGTLLKRAAKGELPLLAAVKNLQKELTSFTPQSVGTVSAVAGAAGDGVDTLAPEKAIADGMRKLTLMVAGLGAQKYGAAAEKEQEYLAAVADMVIHLYAAESAILRAEKLRAVASGQKKSRRAGQAPLFDAMTRLFVHKAADVVEVTGRRALAALEEGDSLRIQLSLVRRLMKRDPANLVALGRRIGEEVLDAQGYPVKG